MTSRDRSAGEEGRRPNLQDRLSRDLDRYARRERDASSFWHSMGVLGAVGWPIVMTAVGGALAGRWLDARWHTGIKFTLMLLVIGVVAGAATAWHLVKPEQR